MANLLIALIYMSSISLGLPDSVLGSAWPVMSAEFNAPIANMGIITLIISLGTITSGFLGDRLIRKLGVQKINVISITLTAFALLGFSISPNFITTCLFAIPYGLGAGSIDVALNNYVAVNLQSKHMNWLHCMWGIGATIGPYIMGMVLTGGRSYRDGYFILFVIQATLAVVLFFSKPIWKSQSSPIASEKKASQKVLSIREIFKIKGIVALIFTLFCYVTIEIVTGMWAGTYLVLEKNVTPEMAAGFSALFYLGITIGRGVCGFIAIKYNDKQMIYGGMLFIAIGVLSLLLPLPENFVYVGLMLVGIGGAPIFPCILHSIPSTYGVERSQAITGVQMAFAYTGNLTMPLFFGFLGENIGFYIYPAFITIVLTTMILMYKLHLNSTKRSELI